MGAAKTVSAVHLARFDGEGSVVKVLSQSEGVTSVVFENKNPITERRSFSISISSKDEASYTASDGNEVKFRVDKRLVKDLREGVKVAMLGSLVNLIEQLGAELQLREGTALVPVATLDSPMGFVPRPPLILRERMPVRYRLDFADLGPALLDLKNFHAMAKVADIPRRECGDDPSAGL